MYQPIIDLDDNKTIFLKADMHQISLIGVGVVQGNGYSFYITFLSTFS
jgi:hypothetical protein